MALKLIGCLGASHSLPDEPTSWGCCDYKLQEKHVRPLELLLSERHDRNNNTEMSARPIGS